MFNPALTRWATLFRAFGASAKGSCHGVLMTNIHRRGFLIGVGGAGIAAASQGALTELHAQSSNAGEAADVTRTLARYIVSAKPGDLTPGVRKEARRTLLNWVGCALGGSRH